MEESPLLWTRSGFLKGSWGPYESFESLVFSKSTREQLQKIALGFLGSQELCTKSKMNWRTGAMLFGPAGCGKTAAAKSIALLLGWKCVLIPAHEILDSHFLSKALSSVASVLPAVIILENVDEIFKRVDSKDFFDRFDSVSESLDGVFWIANTRKPEEVPKNQLIRPGRFEEMIRLAAPSSEVKAQYFEKYLKAFLGENQRVELLSKLEANENLSFAHLQELRFLVTKLLMNGVDPASDQIASELIAFSQEQLINHDRSGARSVGSLELDDRVKHTDPRLLLSALQVTDAFKRVVELTVTSEESNKKVMIED